LAAAYAESSRFSEAVAAAQQAITIAAMQGKTGLANTLRKEIALYRGNMSLREVEPMNLERVCSFEFFSVGRPRDARGIPFEQHSAMATTLVFASTNTVESEHDQFI